MIFQLNSLLLFLCVWSGLLIWGTALTCADKPASEDSCAVVVLHTYLISPSFKANVGRVAMQKSCDLRFVAIDSASADEIKSEIANAEIVLIDFPHSSVIEPNAENIATAIGTSKPYITIGDLDHVRRGELIDAAPLASQHKTADSWAQKVREYYRFGGTANTTNFVKAVGGSIPTDSKDDELPSAVSFPEQGFYHPDWSKLEDDIDRVAERFTQDLPTVAIAVNANTLITSDTTWLDALVTALSKKNINSYAFYGPRNNASLFTEMTSRKVDGKNAPMVEAIINAALVFRPQQRKAELESIGVPVFQTLPSLSVSADQWRNDNDGLSAENLSYYYTSSELAGMIDPILISARNSKNGMLEPIDDQIDALADRVRGKIDLRKTSRKNRRVAMIVYNYPQGENNFGASFLNVPKSLVRVLKAMKESGYSTHSPSEEELTADIRDSLQGLYASSLLADQHYQGAAEFFPLERYEVWFHSLPDETQERIEEYWGVPKTMAIRLPTNSTNPERLGFVIPAVQLGNVMVLPQPLRHEVTVKTPQELRKQRIGHQSHVPLSHTYLATYLYLREQWRADAVVHFGTHGTLEWAPGKKRALSAGDDPFLALDSTPNIYPYIMDNLGEATTAKRRGGAVIVSHLTPMFQPAGFRPGLHAMHELMHDWEVAAPGPVRSQMEKQLIASFVDHKLNRDLEWTPTQIANDFKGFMEVLHPYLDDIAQSSQPQGLAVFGETPNDQRRFGMIMQMLRNRLIEELGEDIDEVFLIDSEKIANSRPARWLRLALKDAEAASNLDLRLTDSLQNNNTSSVPNRAEEKKLDPEALLVLARRAQELDHILQQNNEMAMLLKALDGEHVPSSYGGDPVRNPESLPTGRNLYGFDPTRVPTKQAWEVGVGVFDTWLNTQADQHSGKPPQQIAFTLWAGETMRHQGIMESQILYAIGARPIWNDSGRMTGIKMIPAAELGRPRIDVLLSVTGSYRDQFPQLMSWIDKAVIQAAQSSEANNFVAQHAQAIQKELEADGIDSELAKRYSTARVFSNESGAYGTGLNDAVYASELWSSQSKGGGDAEMADLFVNRMGYAYGKGLGGLQASDLFARQLKNIDAAFLSRSSNTYGVLTSDDAFSYLGGLALAARNANGNRTKLYVQNLRNENEVIVDSASAALAKEMQTRYLHPQWIKAQQAEGYSGALQVLKATQFMWGWQVIAPETIREDQWQSMVDVYVKDQYELGAKEWFQEDNEAAYAQLLERMIDAVRLDYWQPDEATRRELYAAYYESKQRSGLIESNSLVSEFVSLQAELKPDLASTDRVTTSQGGGGAQPSPSTEQRQSTQPIRTVKGMELAPYNPTEATEAAWLSNWRLPAMFCALALLLTAGGWVQFRRMNSRKTS